MAKFTRGSNMLVGYALELVNEARDNEVFLHAGHLMQIKSQAASLQAFINAGTVATATGKATIDRMFLDAVRAVVSDESDAMAWAQYVAEHNGDKLEVAQREVDAVRSGMRRVYTGIRKGL